MKRNYGKIRVCALIISFVLLVSVFYGTFTNVLAKDNDCKAVFTYGDYTGVAAAIGSNPADIDVIGDNFKLPENNSAMNLYWQNGEKTYAAGADVSVADLVKDEKGNYPFTALFGDVSLDFDEIDTEPFTFATGNSGQTKENKDGTLFEQLNKNQWWGIPSGYANDGTTNTALGASNFSIIKSTEGSGNVMFLKEWAESGKYFNASLFTHSPIDTTDPNAHNSNASGSINYQYVYFTPGKDYTLTFDYKLDTTGGGEPPYNASLVFGMDTKVGNDNCGVKNIQYADAKATRKNVDLGTEAGVWKTATVTLSAPKNYIGNGITSARMGISLKVKTGSGCYIDNVKIKVATTKINLQYDDVEGSESIFDEDACAYADDEGNFILPKAYNASNLLWKNGDKYYNPGTELNVKQFGKNLTFKAYFGGAVQDFENINTNTIPLTNKQTAKNLYEELGRNPSYWKVPQGLSNYQAGSDYGIALGHDRMGIAAGVGKTGKGLKFSIDDKYPSVQYVNAALFNHTPTTFDKNSNIEYSYVYYTPGEKYTMEFDYKTSKSVDVSIAFGIDGSDYTNSKCGSLSVGMSGFEKNHITLDATGNEWKHASVTVTAPDSYTGNGVTSARVGIAVKDSAVYDGSNRYDYFDNISFYPTDNCTIAKYDYGKGSGIVGANTVTDFVYGETDITLPENSSAANLLWKNGNNLYTPGTTLKIKDLGKDLTFTAYYGAVTQDFENINTNNISLVGGTKSKNLYEELGRNPGYWKVPQGLSNYQAGSDYGIALGHDRMGIAASVGKSGKGLKFSIDDKYPSVQYVNAALFNHTPTTFDKNSNIEYSYVYYNPGEEYTMEFDYKTSKPVDVSIAFGIDGSDYTNSKCGSLSVGMSGFEKNHITLQATGNDWKHASVTVTAPDSYTGNGVTSARVGIAVKDSEAWDGSNKRYDYFDNISFYPTTMSCHTAKVNYGSDTGDEDSRTISYFKFKEPLKSNTSVTLPGTSDITAALRSGTNDNGLWLSSFGTISNVIGWKLAGTDKVYAPQDSVPVSDLPKNPKFSAIYGNASMDFENVDESFTVYTDNKLSYGSDRAKIKTDNGNTFVRFESKAGMTDREQSNIILFTEKNKFAAYNVNSAYKITFKYRRIDNTKKESRIHFSFGAVPFGWRAQNRKISGSEVCVAQKNMKSFETVTAIVTSPDTHIFQKSNENYYSRAMAIAVELSEGVIIDIDDINVEPVDLKGDSFGNATFDYGDSSKAGDTKIMKFAESIILPGQQTPVACIRKGVNDEGKAWTSSYGTVANQNAWYCTTNKKYYELGQKVSMSEVGKKPNFIAVYENGEMNFDNLSNDFSFVESGKTSYSASLTKVKGTTNKYANITGTETQKDSTIQISLFSEPGKLLAYNAGKTYKVTFKYRRTDNKDIKSSLYIGFGSVLYDWRASSNCVNRITVADTKKGMKDFETVTAYVTAPDTYEYCTGGSNPQYFYARTMSVGAVFNDGVSIDFDDISIEAIGRNEVAMTYYVPDFKKQTVVIGKVGQKLTTPKIDIDRNTVIAGWYKDKDFKTPFNMTTFPETGMTVYGKTADATVRYYGFTDYPWDSSVNNKGGTARSDHHIITKGFSSDGDGYSLKIDNTYDGANVEQQGISLPIRIKPNTKYLISYDFYYDTIGDNTSSYSEAWFNTTVAGSVWIGHKQHITTTDEYVPAAVAEHKWMTGYVYGTTTEFSWSCNLALFVRVPVGAVRYIDNIIITEIPENYSVALFKLGSFQSPKPIVAKTNSTIAMPTPKLDSKFAFINWVLNNEDYTEKTYKLEADTMFTSKTTVRKFGEDFEKTIYGDRGINSFGMDLDWEIYDSAGKSSANVKSGRYSLHKIGKDLRNSAYCLQHNAEITKYSMAIGKIYTVSFWTKVENPVHKLGAINIASCISLANPWDFVSDEFNVAPIADIADGKWHKLSFTFMASGEYLSIIVPGNLSIYIDDVTVEYTPDAKRSENCEFEEYIPAFLTEDGKYIKPDTDSDELGKFQLVKRSADANSNETDNGIILPIVLGACSVVVLGAVALAVILIIKKKKRRQ